ncbi:MAG: hypothetical protein QMC95_07375 [Desulfitobacteriaceae bacterium]|nr:hypothetical protein [Desulfitobacteriaceae bacterium]MDI6914026.1 hypothetical protein [Desulfitobacteriaceae bacterium]
MAAALIVGCGAGAGAGAGVGCVDGLLGAVVAEVDGDDALGVLGEAGATVWGVEEACGCSAGAGVGVPGVVCEVEGLGVGALGGFC